MRYRGARSRAATICVLAVVLAIGGLKMVVSFASGDTRVVSSSLRRKHVQAWVDTSRPAIGRQQTFLQAGLDSMAGTSMAATICIAAVAFAVKGRSFQKRVAASALSAQATQGKESGGELGVILLSAGSGKRMGANMPKQYIKLLGLEIALRSLDAFLACDQVNEIVIVCAEDWRGVFQNHIAACHDVRPVIKYAIGGKERQDSVRNGLACLTTAFAAVHDAARPLVTVAEIDKVVADAKKYGAAVLAVPTKATIKKSTDDSREPMVSVTPNRLTMWEAHTPQVIRTDLLRRGFTHATEKGLAVTDDVSLVECLGERVKLTEGEYTNIKVTTPEDIAVAETILKSRQTAIS